MILVVYCMGFQVGCSKFGEKPTLRRIFMFNRDAAIIQAEKGVRKCLVRLKVMKKNHKKQALKCSVCTTIKPKKNQVI